MLLTVCILYPVGREESMYPVLLHIVVVLDARILLVRVHVVSIVMMFLGCVLILSSYQGRILA